MNRVVPIILVVGLLVGGGFWVSRRAVAETPTPQTAAQTTSQNTDRSTAEDTAEDTAQTSEQTPAPIEGVLTDADLPEGFTLTPFLSDEPVRSFEAADEVLEPGIDYQAVIVTDKGPMRIDLLESGAPVTVNNFVFLALNHYYDGVVFHRVLEDFMAQTGDPTGTGTGGPGYQFANETSPDLKHDKRGVVSMANAGPDTNGSQFFITFGPTPQLDGGYNVFGEVVEGDAVLDDITRIDPQTPSAVVAPEDTLQALTEKGITLAGDAATTVEAYVTDTLGAKPAVGQTFTVDGYTAVAGQRGNVDAYGFFPQPDVIEHVYVVQKPKE
ncbi:hypothetical protein BH24DEI2_BH24DEI2_10770 [soil metagenome]